MSPLLRAYLAFSYVAGPIWRAVNRKRLKRGKELPDRIAEKYGMYATGRPEGTLLWFHALSVGESLALVPLIERALDELPEAHVVLTTSTVTSAEALSKAALPNRCYHVLLPIDTVGATRRFLDHWRPDLAAFSELDFWPRLLVETKRRNIPMALINSRLQEQNRANRQRMGRAMADILGLFDRMLVQDQASAKGFVELGADRAKIGVIGVLKSAARPLPADDAELSSLRDATGDRPIWLAAATHAIEHPQVLAAHKNIVRAEPRAMLIIAPRNMSDADELANLANQNFGAAARRSHGELPDERAKVYVADTIGEMGLWYRLAPVSFVGHSLGTGEHNLEGKNPYEAAALGSAILHGPSVSYFSESYAALREAGGSREVSSVETLASAVVATFDDIEQKRLVAGAAKVIAERGSVLDDTWSELRSLLKA